LITPALLTRMIEPAKRLDRPGDERAGLGGVADVGRHEQRPAARGLDRPGRLGPGRRVDLGDHDGGALGGEQLGAGEADAAPGAGDDGGLVLQSHGRLALRFRGGGQPARLPRLGASRARRGHRPAPLGSPPAGPRRAP
jgi:hypothetical protein